MQEDRFQVGLLDIHRGDARPETLATSNRRGSTRLLSSTSTVTMPSLAETWLTPSTALPGSHHLGRFDVEAQIDPGLLAHQADQLGVRAQGDELALVDDGDMVGELCGFFHVVRGIEHGHALAVELFDVIQDVAAALGIDAHGGLIHDDHLRACAAGPRRC